LSDFNGFAVVDFATHKEINRIHNPDLLPGKSIVTAGADPSHGMAVTPDQKTLVVCSRENNELFSYSLPDLKVIGRAYLGGKGAAWVTLTPDGKTAYVAMAVTNEVHERDRTHPRWLRPQAKHYGNATRANRGLISDRRPTENSAANIRKLQVS
jgi:DNA-binding beta-propeller fold protein YncE